MLHFNSTVQTKNISFFRLDRLEGFLVDFALDYEDILICTRLPVRYAILLP